MKKANNLVLLLILVSFQLTLFSQNGNVQSFIKISQTQANFPITLLNGANFGHALACIGDLNNDGIQDVAISSVNGSDDGTLYISFLDSGGTVNSIVEIKQGLFGLPTNQTYEMDWFGYSVDTIGDLNQDGVIDLVVGLPNIVGGNAKGFVFILFMNDDGTVNSFKILGENLNGFNENLTDTYFGSSVAGLGDLDFDGIYDIVVGGPGKDNDNGAIWILYLNIDGTLKSKIRIDKNTPLISSYFLQSSSSIINFGSSIESLGDLDKDGVIDIIVGSANYSTIYGFGSAAILFLNANGSIKELNAIQPGVTNFNDTLNPVLGFGKSISNIGDVNGDEISDLAFTSPVYSESQCTQCGAVWIVMMDSVGSVKGYQRISDSLGSFSGNLAYNDYFGGASSGIGD
ncbi:MAG: hypothetical protein U9R19_09220, partial [Bacteroidota bacterium]|nr:hypothetical protein [Bacteroidota bacterium]